MLSYIENSKSLLGEGPLYNQKENALYWTDIKAMRLFTYNLETKVVQSYPFSRPIGSFAFTSSDKIITTTMHGYEYAHLNECRLSPIVDPETDKPHNRFNDGKCDAKGRYLAGTMDNDEKEITGSLYSFDGSTVKKLEDSLFISNGLGWSPDSQKFYLTDSPKRVIYIYDYDLKAGTLSHKKVFVTIGKEDGYPDGLCVDSEGYIWSAHWNGWKITRYAPDGSVDSIYDIPVPKVTSCNFGGKDLDTLFITTAAFELSEEALIKAPLSGYTFTLETKVKGQKPYIFKEK